MSEAAPTVAVSSSDGLPAPRRYLAFSALALGSALAVVDGGIVTVALPTISRSLQISPSSAVLIVTLYQVVLVATVLPFAALGDRFGHRLIYQGGQVAFIIAALTCLFLRDLPSLLIARSVQALGAAAALSVANAMLRSCFPASRLGATIGLYSLFIAIFVALAPVLGGAILSVASWRWVLGAAAPFAVLSLLIGWRSLPEPAPHQGAYDWAGGVYCTITLAFLFAGLQLLVHDGGLATSALTLVAGGLMAIAFVRRELRTERPTLPVDLLARREVSLPALAGVVGFVGSMTLLASLPFRLQHQYGFSPAQVGAMIAPWPIAMTLLGPVMGGLSDRYRDVPLAAIGMAAATLGFVTLALLPAHPAYLDVAWRMAFCGAGYAFFLAPNARTILTLTPARRGAAAGSLVSITRLGGQTLGTTLVAGLLAIGIGDGPASAWTAALLALAASLCSLPRLARPASV